MEALKRIVVALDGMTAQQAYDMAVLLHGKVGQVYAYKLHLDVVLERPSIASAISGTTGCNLWMDLKGHDIPSAVKRDVVALMKLSFNIVTVHASGGSEMVAAAVASGIEEVYGVTVLTSVPEDEACEIYAYGYETIGTIAAIAEKGGAHGVVTPVQGIQYIAALQDTGEMGNTLKIVTPGIRPVGAEMNDQLLVKSAAGAIKAGSDILVVGRPVVDADDPPAALHQLADEVETAMAAV